MEFSFSIQFSGMFMGEGCPYTYAFTSLPRNHSPKINYENRFNNLTFQPEFNFKYIYFFTISLLYF